MGLAAFGWLSLAGAAAPQVEGPWDVVALIVTHIQNPQPEPQTKEESIELLSSGLVAFDKAYADAMKAEPQNPMRWEAALFDAMTRPSRQIIGLPPPKKTHFTLAEILQSPEAPARTKAKASFLNVMTAADAPEMDLASWVVLAEKHLKQFPLVESNDDVREKLGPAKVLLKLMEKPMDLKFTASDGREVDLEKMRGKVVLLDFWATWCPLCIAALPQVRDVYKKQQKNGFEVVGISLDAEKDVMDAFVRSNEMPWPHYFDGKGWKNKISSAYAINQLPAMWLIDKNGMLASIHGEHNLAEKVAQLLKE